MYIIQMRFTDSETGYLEPTSNEITAEVFSVFWQPPGAAPASYLVDDFATREDAEACVAELEYLDETEEV